MIIQKNSMDDSRLPRGIRNRNPLNIKKTKSQWLGLVSSENEKTFCVFKDAAYGFRAAFILLKNYYYFYQKRTIRQIINRWAPSVENNTWSYISSVCKGAKILPDDSLPPMKDENRELWINIVLQMCKVENGYIPANYRKKANEAFTWVFGNKFIQLSVNW